MTHVHVLVSNNFNSFSLTVLYHFLRKLLSATQTIFNAFKKHFDILPNLKETNQVTSLTFDWVWPLMTSEKCSQLGNVGGAVRSLRGSRRGRHGSITHHEPGKHWPMFPPVVRESPVDILPILCKPGNCTQTDCRASSRDYFNHRLMETVTDSGAFWFTIFVRCNRL